jgi:hypothetical protein
LIETIKGSVSWDSRATFFFIFFSFLESGELVAVVVLVRDIEGIFSLSIILGL